MMKNRYLQMFFGGRAQVVVGVLLIIATTFQTFWWLVVTPPTVAAVFIVSMEALYFAAYGIIATGLGYRATERVETAVVENIDNAETVTVDTK
jgi:hypothetical protein